jgi:hypothetical protein
MPQTGTKTAKQDRDTQLLYSDLNKRTSMVPGEMAEVERFSRITIPIRAERSRRSLSPLKPISTKPTRPRKRLRRNGPQCCPLSVPAFMLRAADIIEEHREEIVDWLISEAGSTRIKALFEWQILYAVTLEATSFPHRMAGDIRPIDEPGKESRGWAPSRSAKCRRRVD